MKAGGIDAKAGAGFVPRIFNDIVVRACTG